ncbi:MAG: 4-(cytidine 5'-diphospho)-2-C-methyl-D-erythritol kinase [Gemmataceae bacterium]|nr:4-(cytidine 5'-diphospho)-2-C-methyl-D-erythritol kinase [Gemmataceae bacterium]
MGFPSPPALLPMLLADYADDVVTWAPAKVNLYLEVLAKRADGFHELQTLMVAVSLYDTLVFKEDPAGDLQLRCHRPGLSTGPDNLVLRAAELLRQHTGCTRGARIRLVKRIPLAAGLAGGSTDAAAALAGLNRLWGLGLSSAQLAGLGARLGSDVPFFFHTPAALCAGRGEKVTAVPLPGRLWFVLVCPPFGLSTAEVYRGVSIPERPLSVDRIREAVIGGDSEEVGRLLHNRLEAPAFALRPELQTYLARLRALGPAGQAMSGSGSTLFAVCRNHREAVRIARELRHDLTERGKAHVYSVRSCA